MNEEERMNKKRTERNEPISNNQEAKRSKKYKLNLPGYFYSMLVLSRLTLLTGHNGYA